MGLQIFNISVSSYLLALIRNKSSHTQTRRVCQVFCVKGKFREETFPQIQWQIGSVRPSSHELALSIS